MAVAHNLHRSRRPRPWINRLLETLLRSPLAPLLDGSMMLLTVFGSRSGMAYTFPVQYAREGETVWVIAPGEHKTWWRNLQSNAGVRVWLRRRLRNGRAQAYTGWRDTETVARGYRRYLERFPRIGRRLGLPAVDSEEFEQAVRDGVIVRIDLRP
jgi:deazaflavin-dependent oxidoreductase (nitroreductase family)